MEGPIAGTGRQPECPDQPVLAARRLVRAGPVPLPVPLPLPRRLALFDVTPTVAEPVTLLAELLEWEVVAFPAGPASCPPARLCLAMLPDEGCRDRLPVAAWSPDTILNEHISRAGLSIMDQPLCIAIMESMLLWLSIDPE